MFLKDKLWKIVVEVICINLIVCAYQLITMFYKNINISLHIDNFVVSKIMMIDYYLLIILTYLSAKKKGGYIYEQWARFLVVLSNKGSDEESVQQISSNLQKESIGNGFKLFTVMLSVCQFMLVFTLCYFINNVTWQFVVIFISFCVFRAIFGKSYHSNTIIGCTSLSCVVFVIATRLSLPTYVSTLCNSCIGLLVAYMMYIMYYYNKYTNSQGITLQKGMKLETFNEFCSTLQLNEIELKIMTDFYVKRRSLQQIAISTGYSIDNVKKIKAKILKRISEENH